MMLVDAERLLGSMQRCRVIVLGDLMLDEYLWGEISRISPEAPVPVMRLCRSEHALGGAANVARNLASLGASISAIGVVGADASCRFLRTQFDSLNIEHEGVIVDSARPTTRKTRLMSVEHNQQVFRFDDETSDDISSVTEDELLDAVDKRIRSAHVVICSDYLKGVLTSRILSQVADSAGRYGIPLITAPKDVHADKYASATVLMPNYREFARLVGHRGNGNATQWMEVGASMLLDHYHFGALLVTRGSAGMTLFEKPNGTLVRQDIPAMELSVYDVTGAGDTAISAFALALGAGASRMDAARIANIAAAIVVGKRGTACVTREELLKHLHAAHRIPASISVGAGQI